MSPLALLTLALYEPDIAPNAGAMLRSCACFAAEAAIIEPAGFVLTDSGLRRAGMDYLDALSLVRHASFARFEQWRAAAGRRLALLTTKGETALWDFAFQPGDVILVGRESAGVPDSVHAAADARIRIPIAPPLRSLNVAVAAALALGEARRHLAGRLDVTKRLHCAMIIRLWDKNKNLRLRGNRVERHDPGAHRRRSSVGARRVARSGDGGDPRRQDP
jgi:tRNA (cytidine/uridine-2'-O-)-methyltransferase